MYAGMSLGSLTGTLAGPPPDNIAESAPIAAEAIPTTLATPRNERIDIVRAFAAAGIVFVHAVESATFDKWGNLFRFGVPFFLFASLYFQSLSLRRKPQRSLGRFVAGRMQRLYLPFIVWSIIYLFTRDLERVYLHHLGLVVPRISMLWTGTEYHLWFLPLLLGWSIALAIIHKGILQWDFRWRWLLIAAAIGAGVFLASQPKPVMPPATQLTFDDPTYAYIQWQLAFPAAFWAIAFAWFMTAGPRVYRVSAALGWAGIALLVGCSLKQALQDVELAPRALTGLGSMLAALAPWKASIAPGLARLGRKGYGIYLCHVIPVEIIHLIFHKCHLAPSGWLDVANFTISFTGACIIVTLLDKSPRLAWLNG
jgi:peptidoglycan/LPS O-acetylase OafA/YrhL